MSKTVIVYGTRQGMTRESAKIIAQTLRDKYNQIVDVFDLKKDKKLIKLDNYQNIIIGSSIAMGKWTRHAKRFLGKNFDDKKVFIYVCSGQAGEALQAKDQNKFEEVKKMFIENVLLEFPHVKPEAITAFGGRAILFGKTVFDAWDEEPIITWAQEIGKKMK